ncbi:biotin/lipoate A/B protein ligase family protein [Candidatus Methylomirabilis sp.]|uniref:lipoate--protein ligase family protein n=1 Tax=Candidatus Methylomirabilis sp. TaxID=2032687 RepID=UPI002A5EA22C|nr:biotin/lipoate A/B protein ligase family protein [Candidatus Methylomirabilis sp.]
MPYTGRLLRMDVATGPTNMGVDEALATLCRESATLRFYAWEAPTLSIGYSQRSNDIDPSACRKSTVYLVRRPTGGRAVLHRQELTYSLVLPLRPPWTKISIVESYRQINACLLRGLELLGLEVRVGRRPRPVDGALSAFCFSAISQYEVLVGRKKVIGSAQRRFPTALLQQGSILLDFDPVGILDLLRPTERAAAADALGTVGSLREALGRLPHRLEVETAIRNGFAEEMGVEFVEGELRPEELRLSVELATTRYGSEDWTFRR